MRTRDAIRDEQLALRLALESGNGTCPTNPFADERDGWDGRIYPWPWIATPGYLRRWQVGSLARRIWEGLPYAQRWWMYGETEAEMRKSRRRR